MYRVKIISILLLLGILVSQRELVTGMIFPRTAYAVGDLTVDFGVPAGTPMFSIQNSYPGQSISKSFIVTNNSSGTRPLALRGVKGNESGNLSSVLIVTISHNGTDIYGGTLGKKTLANLYNESALPQFISLGSINSSESKTYLVTILFDTQAGNEYQEKTASFDLHVGTAFELPAACSGITFKNQPIYGTQGNDRLTGTAKNDLIIALEGNDVILSGSGNDCVIAGFGNDTASGGSGDDVILGDGGNDIVEGESGDDIVQGGDGNDQHIGGSGKDIMTDVLGVNSFIGGAGNDTLQGSILTDSANGESGRDTCVALTKIHCEN